jgi:hypothetical protein
MHQEQPTYNPTIAQTLPYSHPLQSYLLAVVIPNLVNLAKITSPILGKEITSTNAAALDEAAKDKRVVKAILNLLTKEGVKNGLKGYEYSNRSMS